MIELWTGEKRAVLVLTGTDFHPFTRLCAWADSWAEAHPQDEVIVQHGYSPAPSIARGITLLTPSVLNEALAGADIVITHGGPGTISTVRAAGLLPIIFPRDPKHGEHVDEHQMRFATWAGADGIGTVVTEIDELDAAVSAAATTSSRIVGPEEQIATSVDTLGDAITALAAGKSKRRAFPLLRRSQWRIR